MNPKKGIPVVLSGPSGSGKGTIVKELLARYPNEYALSVSATTRAPRPGERDGADYHFITREQFEDLIARGEMLEYTQYVGNYYGTPKSEHAKTEQGINPILEIEIEGGGNVRRLCPEAVLVFILPPDEKTLRARLTGRGTNTPEDIERRLARAREEVLFARGYDYIVVNEDGGAGGAAERIAEILRAEAHRTARNPELAEKLFSKNT